MQFIVEQQVQFAPDIQKLQEGQQKLVESQVETNNLLNRLAAATVKGFEDVNAKIDALVDTQARTEVSLDAKISALVEAQIRTAENINRTDEAVRNLAELVDRQLRERRNGG